MEGTTSTNGIKVAEVWRHMPGAAAGPAWSELIQDAIDAWEDWKRYNPGGTPEQYRYDGSDSTWADGRYVYTGRMWDAFHTLGLWNIDEVESYAGELMSDGEARDISSMAALYCYAAAALTMDAVLAVADTHAEGGHLCDRCRERFPWDAIHVIALRGYGQLCGECYEIARTIDTGDMS